MRCGTVWGKGCDENIRKVPQENTREMLITEKFVSDIGVFLVIPAVEVIQ